MLFDVDMMSMDVKFKQWLGVGGDYANSLPLDNFDPDKSMENLPGLTKGLQDTPEKLIQTLSVSLGYWTAAAGVLSGMAEHFKEAHNGLAEAKAQYITWVTNGADYAAQFINDIDFDPTKYSGTIPGFNYGLAKSAEDFIRNLALQSGFWAGVSAGQTAIIKKLRREQFNKETFDAKTQPSRS